MLLTSSENVPIPGTIKKIELPPEGYYDKLIEIIQKAKTENKLIILGVYDEEKDVEIRPKKKSKKNRN
jgi:hypothetical protein